MHVKGWGAAAAALGRSTVLAPRAQGENRKLQPLNQYTVRGGDQAALGRLGYDVSEGGVRGGSVVVATPQEANGLRAKGYKVTELGAEATALQAAPPDPFSDPPHGYNVFRPWHLKPAPCPGTC